MNQSDLDNIAYNMFTNGNITLSEYIKYQNRDKIMTREEQIKQAAQKYRETFFDNKSKEGRIAKASFIEGAKWATVPVSISFEEMEEAAKKVMTEDWIKLQENLWSMIERQHLCNFIEKAEKWFYKQLVKGNIYTDKMSMNSLVESFKHAMLL